MVAAHTTSARNGLLRSSWASVMVGILAGWLAADVQCAGPHAAARHTVASLHRHDCLEVFAGDDERAPAPLVPFAQQPEQRCLERASPGLVERGERPARRWILPSYARK